MLGCIVPQNPSGVVIHPVFDWRVKAHGIQVVKLFYLSSKEFKVLRELRDKFVGRLLGERKGPGEAKKSGESKNHRFISPLRDVLGPGRNNPTSGYEATPIWNTRDSLFWGWRRTAEYFRDLFGMDNRDEKEAWALMTS